LNRQPLLRTALVAVAAGGLVPFGASVWWWFDLFAHFRLQYVACAGIFIVVAVFGRMYLSAALLGVIAALNAWPLVPYLAPAGDAPSGVELEILNVNVNYHNRAHADIVDLIRSSGADLVAIVELTPALDRALDAVDEDYPFRYVAPANGSYGLGILSRYPLGSTNPVAGPRVPAIEATVRTPAGELRFVAAHLRPPMSRRLARQRNRQLDVLAEHLRQIDRPVVVCGDFNLTPYSPWFRDFADRSELVDARAGHGLDFSWPTFLPVVGIPIDHCLIRGPLAPVSVERLARIGSDHYPSSVTLVWRDDE
jgi:endonuclease/exonuclease/phosphatase (EEP) superfamily protein YafD